MTSEDVDKLDALFSHPMRRTQHSELFSRLHPSKQKAYFSINSPVVWLEAAASPFFALLSSIFQLCVRTATMADLCHQATRSKQLKSLGFTIRHPRPVDSIRYFIPVLMFSGASRIAESGQLCRFGGTLIRSLNAKSVVHATFWSGHKNRLPVKFIDVAKILAAGEAIDPGDTIAKTYELMFNMTIGLIIDAGS